MSQKELDIDLFDTIKKILTLNWYYMISEFDMYVIKFIFECTVELYV